MNTLSGLRSYDTVLTLDGLSQFDSSIQTQALLIDGSNAMESDINANFHVVKNLDNGVNASDSCTYGQMTTADTALSSALTASYTAADTAQTTAITAAYTAADTTQTTAITAAYTAADNLRLLLAGGVMSGTVSSTTVTTPFDYKNPNGTIIAKLEAGTTAVTNTCTLQMSSNASSILEFRDNLALNVKAQLKYTYGAPGSLSMIIAGVTALSTSNTAATFNVPITMSNIATPLTAVNTGGALNLALSAGTSAVTQPCSIKMASNSQSYTEFTDVAGVTKAWIRYLASGGGSIDLTVANNPMVSLTSSTVTLGGTVQLGGNRITGLAATPASDTDAVPRLYMVDAIAAEATTRASEDALRVRHDGSTALTGSLNLNSNSINNVVNLRSPTNTDLVLGRTGTGNEIQIKATEILIGKMVKIDTGLASIGLSLAGTKLASCYGISGYLNTNLEIGYLSGATVLPKITVTATTTNFNGGLNINGSTIDGLSTATPTANQAISLSYYQSATNAVVANYLPLSGGTMTGGINMFSQNIDGIPDAVSTHQPVSWDQIRANSIVPTAWRSGQMIQRKYLCPALSNSLTTTSFAAGTDNVLISTTLTVTAYNHVLVRGGFEINSNGSGSDTFRIRFEHQTQTVTFNNVVAPTESFRTRYTLYEHLFLPTTSGTKTLTARLYNDSTTGDTITVNNANWIWAVEESQA